ncbi:cbb3-type cytochrome oxidase assembly protein CcoS [Limimaricola hongkongensis]|uniref:RdxS protein n=1 Tax=Limimaricola hongkongensis DSM 17492 TaxID=1122180 RepID=A0A017HF64_9RHOB|nr:cbb3-type cytochrome oxidase assembly protein CcoS [Limimaricola hongkongensis]EYD73122.1 RdxS protein [Limimaricola hongkongensis DSM 17492]
MNVLVVLIPVSLFLGGLGLLGFLWTLKSHQYEDPDGDKARILNDRWDAAPEDG